MADLKISELTNYTPAVDVDLLPIVDTTTTTAKKITWANIKATLKAFFVADQIDIADSGTIITATEVEGALQENRTAINLNTSKVTESTTVTSPLVKTTYDISIPVATTTVSGYLSNTDWNAFNNKGVGDMVLASVQSVTGKKTYDTTKWAMKGSSTGVTTLASANASATDYTATLQAATGTLAYTADITGTNSGTNTGDEVVATGAELDTGTDDVKYASANAIKDSHNVPSVVPSTDGNVLTSNGTDWVSETPIGGGGGITWSAVTSDATMAVDTGSLANKGTLLTLTLPATSAVGKTIRVAGINSGLWKVAQAASQYVKFGNQTTTTGTGGSLASVLTYDAVELVCIEEDLGWVVVSSIGNITVV